MAVDAQSSLILDEVCVRMIVAEVEFRFYGGRDVLIRFPEKLSIPVGHEASMRNNDRNGVVKPSESLEKLGAISVAPGTAEVVCCNRRQVRALSNVPQLSNI